VSAAAQPWADACLAAGVSPGTIAHVALIEALQPVLEITRPGRLEYEQAILAEQRAIAEAKAREARYQAMLRSGRAA
jgi:hypothetical protein